MAEILQKLRPDRDLQCYFERPSAIAAISGAGPDRFNLSGGWRQQFDWAVIEWNRDNVFEHPVFRNLPDGDLSGLHLSYEETRENCIPMDSDLFPTVDWPHLRIWASENGVEQLYKVRLKEGARATPIEGSYGCAWCEFELQGTPTQGDFAGLAFLGEHHTHQLYWNDTIESTVAAIAASVNAFSPVMKAVQSGSSIRLYYAGQGQTVESSTTGANGNRIGVYSYVSGAVTEVWSVPWRQLSGGVSPSKWRVSLDFSSLVDVEGRTVPAACIRKMRWTYAAGLQAGAFERCEFAVRITNWNVTGSRREYRVAGSGSRRIEDDSTAIQYEGTWSEGRGNFSGSSIRWSTDTSARMRCVYRCEQPHALYLGTRLSFNGARIEISVDGGPTREENLNTPGEDTLIRLPLGEYGAGTHSVCVSHLGPQTQYFYFDFLETSLPQSELPAMEAIPRMTLATDWDTDHSIAVAPERTAWMIHSLGFEGRVNHYVGALWFYELYRKGHQYASATVDFEGTPEVSQITRLRLGRTDDPNDEVTLQHLNHAGDTAESIALAFALELNRGYTSVWAEADGARLVIHARAMGAEGDKITVTGSPAEGGFRVLVSTPALAGSSDGEWRTDVNALPRVNRAARDWSRCFFAALRDKALDATAAFSMELQHGDPDPEAGIAQRYPSGGAVLLNTPAVQTNFSPVSLAFWRQVYLDMAQVMTEAGMQPSLQFGEVQWWYFPYDGSGMPFYDTHTVQAFRAAYGRDPAIIASNQADPALYPDETQFLPQMIGNFTSQVAAFVRAGCTNCRIEVLYPTDVNDTPFNRIINYPTNEWTPGRIDCLKTESFTYTLRRDLNASRGSVLFAGTLGFPGNQRSHLVGISDPTTPWLKEARMAVGEGAESVVLFALDQFCLIGYAVPMEEGVRRSGYFG